MRSFEAKWRGSTPHRSNFQPIHLGGSFAMRPFQAKWRGSTSHCSNFQPIHLDESFTKAPCKPHFDPLGLLHILLIPLPKRDPLFRYREALSLL
ncbi:hypothetical protein AVEN_146406-1 [Araneus ventricosus]|uniref:Uncharacterized protein n=1 Tax=Araneus ventricosus TaxID=182803 RepID=A0A4Y2TEZ7_ARAVE|nr:hypothetical protein AVEN_146406-1 [Araneus ventricosus]